MSRRFFSLIFSALLSLFFISLFTFILMKFIPGGPFDGDRNLSPEVLKNLNAKFHLYEKWNIQFLSYIRNIILHLDFGSSIKFTERPVQEIILEALPISLELGLYALIISVVIGIFLGLMSAVFQGSFWDSLAMLLSLSGISLPSFLAAALAILIFSQWLGIFPAALWDSPVHKILPSFVLGLRPAALIARMTRACVLEVLYLDYVRTARAKGLSHFRVLFFHILRNALIPVLTILGPIAASLLTGSFVIEYIFSIPGLASQFVLAVSNRDYPLIMGITLVDATILIFINFLVDFSYGIVDPRMRQEG